MKKLFQILFLLIAGVGLIAEAPPSPTTRVYPVEVRSYLLSDKQLMDAGNFYVKNKDLHFTQWTFHQLKDKPTFIVIMAKNQGQAFVSGILQGSVGDRTFGVPVFGLPRDMEESAVWVIPVGNIYLGEGSTLPQIKMEWKEFSAT